MLHFGQPAYLTSGTPGTAHKLSSTSCRRSFAHLHYRTQASRPKIQDLMRGRYLVRPVGYRTSGEEIDATVAGTRAFLCFVDQSDLHLV
jgi:hypothetical protein